MRDVQRIVTALSLQYAGDPDYAGDIGTGAAVGREINWESAAAFVGTPRRAKGSSSRDNGRRRLIPIL